MEVVLFDGSGREFAARVAACRRTTVELEVLDARTVDRELPFDLTVGVALPKGDRQRWIVEKAVELGVTRLVPLTTDRSERPGGEKLARYVVEASKQCGRNRLMQLAEPLGWTEWLALPPPHPGQPCRRWVAHPGGRAIAVAELAAPYDALLAIGPEGGFTDAEAEAAVAAGWDLVGLGPRLLRIETAAIALVAAVTLASAR
jgi:16S rRNA (uracil1498-N3)-methyltransferase